MPDEPIWTAPSGGSAGVAPSGDTTGATDVANINAALTSSLKVSGVPGGVYYFNNPIYLPSQSLLDMTGCTINVPAGTLINVIRNRAFTAGRTKTDAAATSGSTTLTSATAAFTLGDVGSAVGIVGAGNGSTTWYGTITGVTNSTTCTVSVPATNSISGATLYIFPNRDKNITLRGGNWNFCDTSAGTTSWTQFPTALRRIDGLLIENMTITQLGTHALGGRFNISIADVTAATVKNIRYNGTAGDGVHVMGPASDVSIRDISGTTGDDMVAISPADPNTAQVLTDTQGNITSVGVDGVRSDNAFSGCRVYDGASAGVGNAGANFTISGVTIRDVKGSFQHQAVLVGLESGSLTTMFADEIRITDIAASAGNHVVSVWGQSNLYKVDIDKVAWSGPAPPGQNAIVYLNTPRQAVSIRNVTLASSPSTGTTVGVLIQGSTSGVFNSQNFGCTSLTIDGVFCSGEPTGFVSQPSTFYPVKFDSNVTGNGLGFPVIIRNVAGAPAAGIVCQILAALNLSRVVLDEVDWSGTSLVAIPAGMSSTPVQIANARASGTNVVTTSSPASVEMSNVDANTSGALVAVVGAGATPVAVHFGNFSQAGAGANASKDGTQTVTTFTTNYTSTGI